MVPGNDSVLCIRSIAQGQDQDKSSGSEVPHQVPIFCLAFASIADTKWLSYYLNVCVKMTRRDDSPDLSGYQVSCSAAGKDEAGTVWNHGVDDDKGEIQGMFSIKEIHALRVFID